MPELAEVETVRRVMERALLDKKIIEAEFAEDSIVLRNTPVQALQDLVIGAKVTEVGRKGKFFWLKFEHGPALCGHLGMAGWIRELGEPTARLKEHGKMPLDDSEGRPRFLKMMLVSEEGRKVAMTDGRRLARLWLADDPLLSKSIAQLGQDMYLEPYTTDQVLKMLNRRKAPMKALLLNQRLFAGVGNWVADEVLFQARISPLRLGESIKAEEADRLIQVMKVIFQAAIDAEADENRFPTDWLFHHRWGGTRGSDSINSLPLRREEVGGRTTAWVPGWQT